MKVKNKTRRNQIAKSNQKNHFIPTAYREKEEEEAEEEEIEEEEIEDEEIEDEEIKEEEELDDIYLEDDYLGEYNDAGVAEPLTFCKGKI